MPWKTYSAARTIEHVPGINDTGKKGLSQAESFFFCGAFTAPYVPVGLNDLSLAHNKADRGCAGGRIRVHQLDGRFLDAQGAEAPDDVGAFVPERELQKESSGSR